MDGIVSLSGNSDLMNLLISLISSKVNAGFVMSLMMILSVLLLIDSIVRVAFGAIVLVVVGVGVGLLRVGRVGVGILGGRIVVAGP